MDNIIGEVSKSICDQIEFLAEASRREDISVKEMIECSIAMAELYKVLFP